MVIKTRTIFSRLQVKKPKMSVNEAADAIFQKLFKEEVYRAGARIKDRLADSHNAVRRDKLNLILISLFVFIVDHSASSVFGQRRTKNKFLNAFYRLLRQEFSEYYDFIIELSQKFAKSYRKKPGEPLLGLGICFSNCIKEKDKNDVLAAMAGTTETAKKIRLVTNYYQDLKQEFRF